MVHVLPLQENCMSCQHGTRKMVGIGFTCGKMVRMPIDMPWVEATAPMRENLIGPFWKAWIVIE